VAWILRRGLFLWIGGSLLPLLLPLLLLCSVAFAQASSTTPASIVRVVDGDTVDVRFEDGSTERVRLIGIDTPEVVDPRKPVQCFGREASEHARELLSGKSVWIETDPSQGDRDVYGRLLAYIWLPDGRNFGEVMIDDGYAHEYTYRLPYVYQTEFQAAQDQAMSNQLGLWSPATCAGDTTQPADKSVASPQPSPSVAATPVAQTEGEVQITSVTGARPGGLATVVASTTPSASCTIAYRTPAGTNSTAQGLTPRTADSSGTVAWTWSIGPSTQPGTGGVVVTCDGSTARSSIQIG
jgi:micrococcal nuclease